MTEKHGNVSHTLIRASAGTGKTYQLSNRYLTLLYRHAGADTILATTFTRKAAGEILERVLTRLAKAAMDLQAARELAGDLEIASLTLNDCQRMLAAVCQSLNRVAISTIDSFFNRIAQSFRHELGIPPGVRIVGEDDPAALRIRQQAIEAMLAGDPPEVIYDLLTRLHHDTARRSVTQALDDVLSQLYDTYRFAPDPAIWQQLDVPALLDEAALDQAAGELAALGRDADDKRVQKAVAAHLAAIAEDDWLRFLSTGLAAKILAGQTEFYKKPIPARMLQPLERLIQHARSVLLGREQDRMAAMVQLLQRFDGHYTRLRQQHRVMLFGDLPYLLGVNLNSRGEQLIEEICYRLDRQVSHLLLDEFQDTSLHQWQVLRGFASEICAHADESRSFFCVGDIKQSIYGWRGGQAELFDSLPGELHLDDQAIHSTNVSYRSSAIVLDTVNQVFAALHTSPALGRFRDLAQQWSQDFEAHRAARSHPGYAELITSLPGGASDDQDDDQQGDQVPASNDPHACFVADRVAQLVRQHPARSLAVLTSTNKAATGLIHLLTERGIAASGEGGNPLTDDAAVQLVLSALTLADHPGHQAAAFHVRHSPLAELFGLSSDQPVEAAAVSARLRARLQTDGLPNAISQWVRHLLGHCPVRSQARLLQLVEMADAFASASHPTLRPSDFVHHVQATPMEEPTGSPVRVMTVHRSKGLEFDVVVLAELNRRLAVVSRELVHPYQPDPLGSVQGVYPNPNASIRALDPILQQVHDLASHRRLRDDLCALYVAMTRARHSLHMIVKPLSQTPSGKTSTQGVSDLSFAAMLRSSLCEVKEHFAGQQQLFVRGNANWDQQQVSSAQQAPPLAEPWQARPIDLDVAPAQPRRSWVRRSPAMETATQVQASDLLQIDQPIGRQRGTLLHAWFESIHWADDPIEPASLLELARRAAPGADAGWVSQQLDMFCETLQQPAVRQSLARPTDLPPGVEIDLWRERRFIVRSDQQLLTGIFDRVVVHRRGKQAVQAELLDFKTDRVADANHLAELIEHYRPQLRAYRTALSIMLQLPLDHIHMRLLFTSAGRCVTL